MVSAHHVFLPLPRGMRVSFYSLPPDAGLCQCSRGDRVSRVSLKAEGFWSTGETAEEGPGRAPRLCCIFSSSSRSALRGGFLEILSVSPVCLGNKTLEPSP